MSIGRKGASEESWRMSDGSYLVTEEYIRVSRVSEGEQVCE
jgi:hypothetical protein